MQRQKTGLSGARHLVEVRSRGFNFLSASVTAHVRCRHHECLLLLAWL